MISKATRKQIIEINDLLREHVTTSGSGFCQYNEPWSDDAIAKKVGVQPSSVAAVRREIYGNLMGTRGGRTQPPVDTELREAFLDLTVRFNHLCKALSLARGSAVDAMHLCVNMDALRDRLRPDKTS